MSCDRSWDEDWRETWLADAAYVSMLDRWVRRRHIEHHKAARRRAHDDTVGPWIIAGLVGDIHRHAIANNWLWATTAICFAQELLFCIDDGGVDRLAGSRTWWL